MKSFKQGKRNKHSSAAFRFTAMPDYQAQTLMAAPIVSWLQMMRLNKIVVGGNERRVEEIAVDETIAGETIAEEAPADESA